MTIKQIKHPQLHDRVLLRNLLIRQRTSVRKAAKLLCVPYTCLRYAISQHLSVEEQNLIPRERNRYTKEDKKRIVESCLDLLDNGNQKAVSQFAKQSGINRIQLWSWIKQYKDQREISLRKLEERMAKVKKPVVAPKEEKAKAKEAPKKPAVKAKKVKSK